MGQVGAGSKGQVKWRAHPTAASILESRLLLPAPSLSDQPERGTSNTHSIFVGLALPRGVVMCQDIADSFCQDITDTSVVGREGSRSPDNGGW